MICEIEFVDYLDVPGLKEFANQKPVMWRRAIRTAIPPKRGQIYLSLPGNIKSVASNLEKRQFELNNRGRLASGDIFAMF